jgi:hypothetical protein
VFSGLYRHNSAIFYAEPHLKSFFYYRLVNQHEPVVRQLVKRIQSIRSKERIKHRGAGEKTIVEIEK